MGLVWAQLGRLCPGYRRWAPPTHLTVLLVQVVTPHSPSYPSSHPLVQDRDPRECSQALVQPPPTQG